jgi:hypothetical protein
MGLCILSTSRPRGRCQSFHERLPTTPCLRRLEGKWLNLLDRSEFSRVGGHHRRPNGSGCQGDEHVVAQRSITDVVPGEFQLIGKAFDG